MKLTVQIRLLPSESQAKAIKGTLELANRAANRLSELAWKAKEFRQFKMHHLCYYKIREEFNLVSQLIIRLNAKVADAYKLDKKVQRTFRKYGSIAYDCRILKINLLDSITDLWTVDGRQEMSFVCGENQRKLLKFPKGESDLIYRNLQWFLNVTVDVPEEQEQEAVGWLGIDLGLVNLAQSSDGRTFGEAKIVAGIRDRRWRQRKRLQSKRTRSAKKVLRRLSGRESRFVGHQNHIISKQICADAKRTGRGVALENLKGIRDRIRATKKQRRTLHSWAFFDLQAKIVYKCRLVGVPVKFVDPRNTSRTCPACGCISKKNRSTRDKFACISCGFTADADTNAAGNIARLASVIRPHERKGERVQVQSSVIS